MLKSSLSRLALAAPLVIAPFGLATHAAQAQTCRTEIVSLYPGAKDVGHLRLGQVDAEFRTCGGALDASIGRVSTNGTGQTLGYNVAGAQVHNPGVGAYQVNIQLDRCLPIPVCVSNDLGATIEAHPNMRPVVVAVQEDPAGVLTVYTSP